MQTGLKEYFNKIKLLQTKLSRSTQPRDKQGHFVKVKQVESEWYEYIGNKQYNQFCFVQGEKYQINTTQKPVSDMLIYLIGENGASFLVEKKYFKVI